MIAERQTVPGLRVLVPERAVPPGRRLWDLRAQELTLCTVQTLAVWEQLAEQGSFAPDPRRSELWYERETRSGWEWLRRPR